MRLRRPRPNGDGGGDDGPDPEELARGQAAVVEAMRHGRHELLNGGEAAKITAALAVDQVWDVVASVLRTRGLSVIESGDGAALTGGPGTHDPFMPTVLRVAPGRASFECLVPVLVPEERVQEVLELCSAVNTQLRVVFRLGPRYTPVAFMTTRLLAGVAHGAAADAISYALDTIWERAAAAESLFRAVAAGASPHDAVAAHLAADEPSLYNIFKDSDDQTKALLHEYLQTPPEQVPYGRADALPIRHPEAFDLCPVGTRWHWTLPDDLSFPDPPPPGYTAPELRATTVVIWRLVEDFGVGEACAGPVLIHADGAVECFACNEPSQEHLGGCTVACVEGVFLGIGHRCERCGELP